MAGATVELNEKNFEDTLKKGGTLFIDFWAGWCGPCRAFAPTYEAAAGKHPDLIFGKVDTEAERGLAAAFEIRSIPTLAIFRDGILLGLNSGALPPAALEELIAKVGAIDMNEVKADVAARMAAADKAKAEAK